MQFAVEAALGAADSLLSLSATGIGAMLVDFEGWVASTERNLPQVPSARTGKSLLQKPESAQCRQRV